MKEMQEMRVQSLVREDPRRKAMATHSSVLAWRIPGTEDPGGLQSIRLESLRLESDTTEATEHASMRKDQGCSGPQN